MSKEGVATRDWRLPSRLGTSAVVPLVVALAVSALSLIIWATYYTYHPLWVEHAAYGLWSNVRFADVLSSDAVWRAVRGWAGDERHLLQPLVIAAVSPRLLAWPHAHVLVTGAALCLFLVVLAQFVRERTGSTLLALGSVAFFGTFRGLYDERHGIGAPWPDYQSMLFLAAAAVLLARYALSARVRWLALAGTCVSLAALARDVAAIYAAVICAPIVVLLMVKGLRAGAGARGAVRIALWCGVPALPAVVLLASRSTFFGEYYMTANVVQLRQSLGMSLRSVWQLLSAFCGPATLGALAVLAAGSFLHRRQKWSTVDTVVVGAPVLFLLFLVMNGYTSDTTKEVMYLAPGLLSAAISLHGGIDLRRGGARILVWALLAWCVISAGTGAAGAYTRARHPTASDVALRESQRAMAAALASIPSRAHWHSFSRYDWGTVVSALTYYEFGRYQPTDNRLFHNRKNYWDARFPGMDLPQLQAHVLQEAERSLDVAIVLKNPADKPDGMEDYSFSIASYVAERIQASPDWQHYRDIHTSVSGPLALYLNRRRMSLQ